VFYLLFNDKNRQGPMTGNKLLSRLLGMKGFLKNPDILFLTKSARNYYIFNTIFPLQKKATSHQLLTERKVGLFDV
jgi:hypothetical protein